VAGTDAPAALPASDNLYSMNRVKLAEYKKSRGGCQFQTGPPGVFFIRSSHAVALP
jgi:hypothetical protein